MLSNTPAVPIALMSCGSSHGPKAATTSHNARTARPTSPERDQRESRGTTRRDAGVAALARSVSAALVMASRPLSLVPQPRIGDDRADVGDRHEKQVRRAEDHRAGLHERHVALRDGI